MGLLLTIELVPASAWNQNLRSILPKSAWEKIRKEVFAKSGYKCVICGSSRKLECHEVWEYNDREHLQKLAGFLALCELCHGVKHIGFTGLKSDKNKIPIERYIKHFMKVNVCDRSIFNAHYKKVLRIWEKRSRFEWTLDLGKISWLSSI
jgi:hypothetical protein